MQEEHRYYVYVICDPRVSFSDSRLTHLPIYVGKGSGNRWASHLKEAQGHVVSEKLSNKMKCNMIRDIYDAGYEPEVVFIERNIDSSSAYDVEKSLIIKFGRIGFEEGGILANRVIDQRSLGGGKKGMKQSKPRSNDHRSKISAQRTGWKPSETTRTLWKNQRVGKIHSKETKQKMSSARRPGELWEVTHPDGIVEVVSNLKNWCREKNLSYFVVWGNRNGFKANRFKSDALSAKIEGFVHITDVNTKEVLASQSNQVHFENMSQALAMSLADRSTGHIHEMVFGNGGSTVSGTGAVTYFPPNVTGQTAQLYNQTYRKVIDDMSPLDVNPSDNNLRVQHTQNSTYTDIVITCTLETSEPSGQLSFDNTTDTENAYVFDEIGLKSFAAIEGTGMLLSHVIFHPVQKALNRTIEIVYTVRIFMS